MPLEAATMLTSNKSTDSSNDESSNSSVQDAKNMINADNASFSVKLRCWLHLMRLVSNSITKYNSEVSGSSCQIDPNLPVVLVGFSKGCIIINELCNELEFLNKLDDSEFIPVEESNELKAFLIKVKHLVWLDGGHSGQSNNWITRAEIMDLIKQFGFKCYVYVTPYQIQSRKYWAVEEYKKFVQLLEAHRLFYVNKYYFEERDEDFDIHVHFELINNFDTSLI